MMPAVRTAPADDDVPETAEDHRRVLAVITLLDRH